uniref:LOB domain-containing protein 20 n=1 Tax=Anthurium amnicola TaxID=1678845 RepID=A0A1D1YFH6_9ARAE
MDAHTGDSSDVTNNDGHTAKAPRLATRVNPAADGTGTGQRTPRHYHHDRGGGSGSSSSSSAVAPCGACKYLRRKCVEGCVFAADFGGEHGAARFAAVHRVFGASNVGKLLRRVPAARRHDAVATICYEAQARLSDPVFGCISTVLALHHQVASLHAELSMVQMQLVSSRMAADTAAHCHQQQQQQDVMALQPTYSDNSSASNNFPTLSTSLSSGLNFAAAAPPWGMEPLRLSQPSQAEDGDEEDNRDPSTFVDQVLSRKL